MKFIKINENDNVAVAIEKLAKGTVINCGENTVEVVDDISAGHKVALKDIECGTPVVKYGYTIGNALQDIKAGQWIHTHNIKTALDGILDYTYVPTEIRSLKAPKARTFQGYRRKDGKVGIRNEVWIIPTVGCVNGIVKSLEKEAQKFITENIDAVVAFPHPYGCSQLDADQENTRHILADLVNHQNAGGVLVVGLGCENSSIEILKKYIGDYDENRVRFLKCQDHEDEISDGLQMLRELVEYASSSQREEIDAGELVIGLKCGGSDGFSGITANPLCGRFSDMLVSLGGTAILTEVPEMFGAETILMNRAKDKATFEEIVDLINDFRVLMEDLNLLDRTNDIISNLSNNNNLSLAKDYKISYEKLDKSLLELEGLLVNYHTNLYDFVNIIKAYFENVSITIPPIIGDVVMVYDTNSSFIVKNDYMYMLSCVEGLVPKVTSDLSLILDKEINYFDEKLRLSPTCDVINRRSKFKVFENIFKANKSLTICYYKSSMGSSYVPSLLITSLHRCMPGLIEISGDDYITNYGSFDNDCKNVFLLNNISANSAETNLINLTKNFESNFNMGNFNKMYFSLVDAMPNKNIAKMYLSNHTYNNNVEGIGNINYFKKNKTSVSEIESYYSCPYKHFVKYGLNLIEKTDSTFKANDIGNIIHEFASVIISKLVGDLDFNAIYELSSQTLKGILNEKYIEAYITCRNLKNNILDNDNIVVDGIMFTACDALFNYFEEIFPARTKEDEEIFKNNPVEQWKFELGKHMLIDL